MPQFIAAGIFEKDYRDGLPIRDILRVLDKDKQLSLFPYIYLERMQQNTNWFFAPIPMQQDVKLALLQILEERHVMHATLITARLPVSVLHEYINEPTVADAIMDRLTAGAHRIELKGESMRRNK